MMKNFSQNKRYKLKGGCIPPSIKKKYTRAMGEFGPFSRRLLAKIKDEKITSIRVVRNPLNSKLLNFLTLGHYSKVIKKHHYKDTYHLGIEFNDKYTYHKQAIPNLEKGTPISHKTGAQGISLKFDKDITIGEFINNAKNYMGDCNFSEYDVCRNNCQTFTIAALAANGIHDKILSKFIKQDIESIYSELPFYTKPLTDFATNAGAMYDYMVHGAGVEGKIVKPTNKQLAKILSYPIDP
jgi:hypothetical protein